MYIQLTTALQGAKGHNLYPQKELKLCIKCGCKQNLGEVYSQICERQ